MLLIQNVSLNVCVLFTGFREGVYKPETCHEVLRPRGPNTAASLAPSNLGLLKGSTRVWLGFRV